MFSADFRWEADFFCLQNQRRIGLHGLDWTARCVDKNRSYSKHGATEGREKGNVHISILNQNQTSYTIEPY